MTLLGDILSYGPTRSADKQRKKAVRQQRAMASRRAIQARRMFIRKARATAAANLVQTGGAVADFGSSRFQGQQASIETQKQFGLFEQQQDQDSVQGIESALDSAANFDRKAGVARIAGDIVQTVVQNT